MTGRDDCPACGGGLRYTGEERITANSGHRHVMVYECGNCGRRVER